MDHTGRAKEDERLAEILRETRIEAGFSQLQVATRLGVAQSWVSNVETGVRRIDLVECRALALAVEVTLEEIVRRFEEEVSET